MTSRDPDLQSLLRPNRRRGFRRVRPGLLVLLGLGTLGAITWLWYWVFSPLGVDPKEWAQQERSFRYALSAVLVEKSAGDDAVSDKAPWPRPMNDTQVALVACAYEAMTRGARLSVDYHAMRYPWGDIPARFTSSADLIIRCLRTVGLDLQQMIHIDRVANPRRYPLRIWKKKRPDKSIDHRRLPNLYTFIKAFSDDLGVKTITDDGEVPWQPGDIVFWGKHGAGEFPTQLGLVTDRRGEDGIPWVVTVAPGERRISDNRRVTAWQIRAHVRPNPTQMLDRFLAENPKARLVSAPSP